ncbi:MAG: Glyoxalase/bleomycin resistance protein/dioxygenase [Thermoleophilia bacterium]|nr:Glyoxalase/bleomycin resistance protein/dioxygenase [Thermoleophilia bacterium]
MHHVRFAIPASPTRCHDVGMETTTHTAPTTAIVRAEGRATGALVPDELRLGATRLIVTDLARSTSFYQDVLGLTRLADSDDGVARFGGTDDVAIIELVERPGARRAGRHAGLYHVALLYPSREELARVVERIAATRTMIDGASDHGSHEAIYLPDPDGNGLELAADRPRDAWPDLSNIEEIRPRPLDMHALLATVAGAGDVPERAGDGVTVGHLHLHVGDIPEATAFYVGVVGFESITSIPVAGFVSAGGYHHHLAFNTWKGEGVGPAPHDAVGLGFWMAYVPAMADLDELAQRLADAGAEHERATDGSIVLRDPWRNELRVSLDPEAVR